VNDFGGSIKTDFDKVYAISSTNSWTNAKQFQKFCNSADIPCEEIIATKYFKDKMVDGAYLTKEYTYDAEILKKELLNKIAKQKTVIISYKTIIKEVSVVGGEYILTLNNGQQVKTAFVLNATYAGVNHIHRLFGFEPFKIKYELCEIILCKINPKLANVGLTVMDGPFFSIMPFGKTGLHSLTSVTFTPHITSTKTPPDFACRKLNEDCTDLYLCNCNDCKYKPKTAWDYMSQLARKYLKDDFEFTYHSSLFSIKPILKASEVDDSRPTIIKQMNDKPKFYSVLSGKINTVYDMEEILNG